MPCCPHSLEKLKLDLQKRKKSFQLVFKIAMCYGVEVMQIITAAEARALGLPRYFTREPCPRGHLAERFVSTRSCVECNRAGARLTAEEVAAKLAARQERDRLHHEQVQARLAIRRAREAAAQEQARLKLEARLEKIKNPLPRSPRPAAEKRERRKRATAREEGFAPAPHDRDCPPRPLDGRCQCCGEVRKLELDHCHLLGDFRGWICNPCNRGIGALGDDRRGVLKAAAYLRRWAAS